jgi:hypothetical protein
MTTPPTFPQDIFPEDRIDPTAGTKETEYHVERTLGVIGHVRGIAKKRHWRYLRQEGVPAREAFVKIREFYELPENAPVVCLKDDWAVWAGEGEPSGPAFEQEPHYGTFPDEETLETRNGHSAVDPILAEVLKNAPPGTVLSAGDEKVVIAIEAGEREAALKEAANAKHAKKIDETLQETWAYSTKDIADHSAMRARYGARADAPIVTDQSGDIAAIWLGKGAPPRAAFPNPEIDAMSRRLAAHGFVSSKPTNGFVEEARRLSEGVREGRLCPVCGEPKGSVLRPGVSCTGESHPNALDYTAPPDVSPHVPSAALNDMGLKIYRLSRNVLFTVPFREYLLKVSDSLHAEAARMELAKVRKNFDSRNG